LSFKDNFFFLRIGSDSSSSSFKLKLDEAFPPFLLAFRKNWNAGGLTWRKKEENKRLGLVKSFILKMRPKV